MIYHSVLLDLEYDSRSCANSECASFESTYLLLIARAAATFQNDLIFNMSKSNMTLIIIANSECPFCLISRYTSVCRRRVTIRPLVNRFYADIFWIDLWTIWTDQQDHGVFGRVDTFRSSVLIELYCRWDGLVVVVYSVLYARVAIRYTN